MFPPPGIYYWKSKLLQKLLSNITFLHVSRLAELVTSRNISVVSLETCNNIQIKKIQYGICGLGVVKTPVHIHFKPQLYLSPDFVYKQLAKLTKHAFSIELFLLSVMMSLKLLDHAHEAVNGEA